MKNRISIHIGEYHASNEPSVIHTILGSCVAVCLFDPASRIGGMNHILLPGKADVKHFNESARYGINAMELLINRMMGIGGNRRRFIAKVFGGAHVLPAISKENGTGEKNASFALEFLKNEKIKVLNKDVGGTDSRKIYFHTDTGDAFLKRISRTYQRQLATREASGLKRMRKTIYKPGKVTLFDK